MKRKVHCARRVRQCAVALNLFVIAILLLICTSSWAKDAPVTAVLLFNGPNGPSYAQISGLLFNGKAELRVCSGHGPIDKSVYKNLPKLNVTSVRSLQRSLDGAMSAITADATVPCVVPGNFKFDKANEQSVAELVDKSSISGQVVGSSNPATTAMPAFAPGSELVLGSATDKDWAEYLRASHAASVPLLQAYIATYANGPHSMDARKQLAGLLTSDGSAQLEAYRKTAGSKTPSFPALKAAREDADGASTALTGDDASAALAANVQLELKAVVTKATGDLNQYRQAIAEGKPGYAYLVEATELSKQVSLVDSRNPAGAALATDVQFQRAALDAAIKNAQTQIGSKQFEMAAASLKKYQAFADENDQVGQLEDQLYKHYMANANEATTKGNWTAGLDELKRAAAIKDTPEVKAKLAAAQTGLQDQQNKAASTRALAQSQEYEGQNDRIQAYEVLADLTPAQQVLVHDQMAALEAEYVKAAMLKAQQLQQTHMPMHGREDENAMRQAYDYYRRASQLSDDEDIKVKMDLVADEISNYYVELGKRYMEKPLSSEVGVGWEYMTEALQYRNNLDEVRDEMTKNGAAYQMRAKLSIGVVFRDQTSRRDLASADFADQMQQAFATSLETSGLPVKVILPGNANVLQPNFQFIGEILDHRAIRNPKRVTLESKYRSGSREVPNPDWNKADQAYEASVLELQRAQSALQAAQVKNNKKMIDQASKSESDLEQKVQELRGKMNELPKTLSEPIVSSYSYNQTSLELTDVVKISFRLVDGDGNVIEGPFTISKGEKPRKFVVLDGVKSEDTQGIKDIDLPPDEAQLMADTEIEGRDEMLADAQKAVQELPKKVLVKARTLASSGDADGAAELYVLYLNSTPKGDTTERIEAAHYLSENFNIRHGLTLSASIK